MWPITTGGGTFLSAYDQLLKFCSTINGQPYYFQRSDQNSTNEIAGIIRNSQLIAYLQNLTGRSIPGYGTASFSSKLGAAERNQVLVSMFDLIRQTNLLDFNLTPAKRFARGDNLDDSTSNDDARIGSVAPTIYTTGANTFMAPGRMVTVAGAAMVFIATADTDSATSTVTPNPFPATPPPPGPFTITIPVTAFPLLDLQCPSYGMTTQFPSINVRFTSITGFAITPITSTWSTADELPRTLSFNNMNRNQSLFRLNGWPVGVQSGDGRGGPLGPSSLFINQNNFAGGWPTANGSLTYSIATRADLPKADYQLMNVAAGSIVAEIHDSKTDTLLQTVTVAFPEAQTVAPIAPRVQRWALHSSSFGLWPYAHSGPKPPTFANRFALAQGGDGGLGGNLNYGQDNTWRTLIQPGDTVLSMVGNHTTAGCDYRLFAMEPNLGNSYFQPHPDYPHPDYPAPSPTPTPAPTPMLITAPASYFPGGQDTDSAGGDYNPGKDWPKNSSATLNKTVSVVLPVRQAHSFRMGESPFMLGYRDGSYISARSGATTEAGQDASSPANMQPQNPRTGLVAGLANVGNAAFGTGGYYQEVAEGGYRRYGTKAPILPRGTDGVFLKSGGNSYPGDWENGTTASPDGPYLRKPDDGYKWVVGTDSTWGPGVNIAPYYYYNPNVTDPTLFSPNRIIASPIQFGGLPSGFQRKLPWQTLLFCPNPAAGLNHPGAVDPADYLLLDLFWMPVVQPYAISEPFATAGKINMNYQLMPFNFITRSTALRGVLKGLEMEAIPVSAAKDYKKNHGHGIFPNDFRYSVSADETLTQFENRFSDSSKGNVFKSPAEICSIFLIPENRLGYAATGQPSKTPTGVTLSSISTFWSDKTLTGDNTREAPFDTMYSRLTTKSNTYTVHYRVQALKKAPNSPAGTWNDAKDKVNGEFRGSTTIERYINPNDTTIPDYPSDLSKIDSDPLSTKYKWRVVNTRQFAP